MKHTLPTTNLHVGQIVTAEFKRFGGDVFRSGHVVGVDPVQVYFGPWTGTLMFSPQGWEQPRKRWSARLVEEID